MKPQPELTIHEELVSDLIPYENNAKIHDFGQVETIVNSIEDYGFNDPVAIWHNNEGQMEIVEGHGRVLAAQKLGMEKLPVIYLDHLTDKQRREYVHVHNQTTLNSGFNVEMLNTEIKQLDFDAERFGFDPIALYEYGEEEPNERWGGVTESEGIPSDEEIAAYSEEAENECLKSYNVVISCMDEEEKAFIAEMLGVEPADLHRFYKASELMAAE